MRLTRDKVTDTVTSRIGAARELLDSRVLPVAVPAGRKAAEQVKQVVGEKIVPLASTAVDNALVASAPVRTEAARRGRLAAAALRGVDSVAVKKRRRWPVAVVFLAVGSAVGAIGAWLTQAGKPVQLRPYPLADPADNDAGSPADSGKSETVDLTDDPAHHAG
jgi:hypothetical protein